MVVEEISSHWPLKLLIANTHAEVHLIPSSQIYQLLYSQSALMKGM
jgi:hypothetical protein